MSRPKLLVGRPTYPEVIARLREHFDVTDNQDDKLWTTESWTAALSQHEAALCVGIEPVNEAVLAACPQLRICANLSVGYNNFDVPAMTRHKVLATNAPDVLNETTADLGFALMMAAARRVSESEIYIRQGNWTHWRYDQFAGAEVHGSTLGIIGMGRIGQGIAKRGAFGFWHESDLSQPQPCGRCH
jgi:glyoxylate/hydroxypyruvate/2-ketogluconate reductase